MSRVKSLFLALLAFASVSGCADSTAPGTGSMTILLTDAPGDFKKAVVTISQIYLQGGEGEDAPPGGRVVLRDEEWTGDLLTLANETAALVEDATVPAGRYEQLRFVITGGYIEVENADGSTSVYASSPTYAGLPAGTTVDGPLQMPSFAETGIKVNLPDGGIVISGDQKILLVDFDVSQSFGQQAGLSGMWVMHPVVTAIDFSASGSVIASVTKEAAVTASLGDFKAVLTDANNAETEIQLTDPDNNGVFEAKFQFLLPGDYMLTLEAPSGVTFSTDVSLPISVSVPSGQDVTKAIVVKPAS